MFSWVEASWYVAAAINTITGVVTSIRQLGITGDVIGNTPITIIMPLWILGIISQCCISVCVFHAKVSPCWYLASTVSMPYTFSPSLSPNQLHLFLHIFLNLFINKTYKTKRSIFILHPILTISNNLTKFGQKWNRRNISEVNQCNLYGNGTQ